SSQRRSARSPPARASGLSGRSRVACRRTRAPRAGAPGRGSPRPAPDPPPRRRRCRSRGLAAPASGLSRRLLSGPNPVGAGVRPGGGALFDRLLLLQGGQLGPEPQVLGRQVFVVSHGGLLSPPRTGGQPLART